MNQYIYIRSAHKILYKNLFKIGSTINIKNRMSNVRTELPVFDDSTHDLTLFKIYGGPLTCYELDSIVRMLSFHDMYSLEPYYGTGGTEFYKANSMESVTKDVKNILHDSGAIFGYKSVDIRKLMLATKNYDSFPGSGHVKRDVNVPLIRSIYNKIVLSNGMSNKKFDY